VKDLTDVKEVVGWLLGASIAVVWLWFALLGVQTVGSVTALFIAIAVTILFGTLSGGLIALSRRVT
jgi:hypothetical protein